EYHQKSSAHAEASSASHHPTTACSLLPRTTSLSSDQRPEYQTASAHHPYPSHQQYATSHSQAPRASHQSPRRCSFPPAPEPSSPQATLPWTSSSSGPRLSAETWPTRSLDAGACSA